MVDEAVWSGIGCFSTGQFALFGKAGGGQSAEKRHQESEIVIRSAESVDLE